MRIKVQELAQACLTRRKGNEASESLLKMDNGSEIEVDLNGAEPLSLSFLDELIFRVNQSHASDRLAFVTDNPNHLAKLGRISGFRGVTIRRMLNGRPQPIAPEESPKPEATALEEEPPDERP